MRTWKLSMPLVLAAMIGSLAAQDESSPPKIDLAVLYVGSEGGPRTSDFVRFLREHFSEVGTAVYPRFEATEADPYDDVVLDVEMKPTERSIGIGPQPKLPEDYAAWRRWLDAARPDLFFSDVGGFRFFVARLPSPQDTAPPGKQPKGDDPVAVSASLSPTQALPGDIVTLAIRIDHAPGWHARSPTSGRAGSTSLAAVGKTRGGRAS